MTPEHAADNRVRTGYPPLVNPLVTILLKTVCGGALVLAFAVLSEMLTPKRFAGILGAAPSVAIAGLAIGALSTGAQQQAVAAATMIAGAFGLVAYSVVAVPAVSRFGPLKGAAVAGLAWLVVAGVAYPAVAP